MLKPSYRNCGLLKICYSNKYFKNKVYHFSAYKIVFFSFIFKSGIYIESPGMIVQVSQGEERAESKTWLTLHRQTMLAGTGLPFSDSHEGLMTRDRWSCKHTESQLNDGPVFHFQSWVSL